MSKLKEKPTDENNDSTQISFSVLKFLAWEQQMKDSMIKIEQYIYSMLPTSTTLGKFSNQESPWGNKKLKDFMFGNEINFKSENSLRRNLSERRSIQNEERMMSLKGNFLLQKRSSKKKMWRIEKLWEGQWLYRLKKN